MGSRLPYSGKTDGAQTAGQALDLLTLVVYAGRPLALVELARESGASVSSTYRRMQALEARALVARDPHSRRYVIGGGLIALSAVISQSNAMTDIARPYVQKIAALTTETAAFCVRLPHHRITVYTAEGIHPVRRIIPIGEKVPLYSGPTGKVMLAHLPAAEKELLRKMAEDHEADLASLDADLKFVYETGYLAKISDRTPGLGAIAVPVFAATGIAGALTASGPQDRWSEKAMRAVNSEMRQLAFDLSVELGASNEFLSTFNLQDPKNYDDEPGEARATRRKPSSPEQS